MSEPLFEIINQKTGKLGVTAYGKRTLSRMLHSGASYNDIADFCGRSGEIVTAWHVAQMLKDVGIRLTPQEVRARKKTTAAKIVKTRTCGIDPGNHPQIGEYFDAALGCAIRVFAPGFAEFGGRVARFPRKRK